MSEDFTLQAILRPVKKSQNTETVTAFARTGRRMVKVRLSTGSVFAVDAFRLFQVNKRTLHVPAEDLAALRWEGKGLDPLNPPHADTSGGLPLMVDP